MSIESLSENIDLVWIMVCTVLVLLMQPGFACLEIGLVRAKNTINVAMKNIADFCLAALLFWVAGYGIMFGLSQGGVIGSSHFLFDPLLGPESPAQMIAFFFFQAAFCGAATTIVSGAVAERMSFRGYFVVAGLISLLIYPLFGHWAWGGLMLPTQGWLQQAGFVDFAGSTVVHGIGGWVALAAIIVLGPRIGRFGADGGPIEPHSPPTAILGIFLLWIGWFGFNGGSELALNGNVPGILLNTMMAGVAGSLTVLLLTWFLDGRPAAMPVASGAISGLVAITAGVHVMTVPMAMLVGGIGGAVGLVGSSLLARWRIDDVVSAVPSHLMAGIWGTLAVALFADMERLGTGLGRIDQLAVQALGVGAAAVVGFGITLPLLMLVNRIMPLRVPAEFERVGLNASEHGANTALIELVGAMDEHRQTGDFSRPVRVEPSTEAGDIATQYNQVLTRFSQEVEGHRLTSSHLQEALGRAELANASKSQFLANMSHELRTPLNAIIGFSEIIRDEMFGPVNNDRYKDYAVDINNASKHLLSLINDILDLSKIEADKFDLSDEQVDINEVLTSCQRMLNANAEETDVDLRITVAPDLPLLRADSRAIHQIVLNLLSNGIKFTPAGGSVSLDVVVEPDGRLAITVCDTGVGISKENISRAFEPFTQITNSSLVYSAEGTGLGLPLTAALTRLHDASMVFDSAEGKGTTIVVRFPLDRIIPRNVRLSA
ncbi:MAG: ammonium transporter [Minwuia sp.]|nr:ammonium transporter [Minwuia sp.]